MDKILWLPPVGKSQLQENLQALLRRLPNKVRLERHPTPVQPKTM